jgi:hypothetical protein
LIDGRAQGGGRLCRRGRPGEASQPAWQGTGAAEGCRARPSAAAGASRLRQRSQPAARARCHLGRNSRPRARTARDRHVRFGRRWRGRKPRRNPLSAEPGMAAAPSHRHRTARAADGVPEGRLRSRHHCVAARLRPVGGGLGLHAARPGARRAWHFGSRRADCRQPDACADREILEIRATDRARDENCPLDLNALVPVPDKLLRLGPEDPAVLAWL